MKTTLPWFLTFLIGCSAPTLQEGFYECLAATDCPSGWSCHQDGFCYSEQPLTVPGEDGGEDAGEDSGQPDAVTDSGTDSMVEPDAGTDSGVVVDAGVDATIDSGSDSGTDASEPWDIPDGAVAPQPCGPGSFQGQLRGSFTASGVGTDLPVTGALEFTVFDGSGSGEILPIVSSQVTGTIGNHPFQAILEGELDCGTNRIDVTMIGTFTQTPTPVNIRGTMTASYDPWTGLLVPGENGKWWTTTEGVASEPGGTWIAWRL